MCPHSHADPSSKVNRVKNRPIAYPRGDDRGWSWVSQTERNGIPFESHQQCHTMCMMMPCHVLSCAGDLCLPCSRSHTEATGMADSNQSAHDTSETSDSHSRAAPLDAILLTASNPSQAAAFREEVNVRRARGSLPSEEITRVIVVCDPKGVRIGSGGATLGALHALLLSLPGSHSDRLTRLKSMRIGLFHSGGDSQRLPTCSIKGKAFCAMPAIDHKHAIFETTPLDHLFEKLARIIQSPGCIITATDCLFDLPADYPVILPGTPESVGVVGCTVETPAALGSNHGVFVLSDSNTAGIRPVTDILQKASQDTLAAAAAITNRHTVLLDSGIIFLSPDVLESLLGLIDVPPFHTCLESAHQSPNSEPAFRFELYTDLLLPLNPAMTLDSFIASAPPDPHYPTAGLIEARRHLWTALHRFKCFGAVHPDARFFHMGTMDERMDYMFSPDPHYARLRAQHQFELQAHVAWSSGVTQRSSSGAAILNSMFDGSTDAAHLASGAFIEHTHLTGEFAVGAGAVVSGVRSASIAHNLRVPPRMCVQESHLRVGWTDLLSPHDRALLASDSPTATVLSIFHIGDPIKTPFRQPKATFCKQPFATLLAIIARAMHTEEAQVIAGVWPGITNDASKTLWNAKVFPLMTLDSCSVYPFLPTVAHGVWMFDLPSDLSTFTPSGDLTSAWHRWFESIRVSFADLLAYADCSEENRWRDIIAAKIDAALIRQIITAHSNQSDANAPILPYGGSDQLLDEILRRRRRALASLNEPLLHDLDLLSLDLSYRVVDDSIPLDLIARVLWLQGQIVDAAGSESNRIDAPQPCEPTKAALREWAATAQPNNCRQYIPRIIRAIGNIRTAGVAGKELIDLYDLAISTLIRCSVARPVDLSYGVLPSVASICVGSLVSVRGCVRLDLMGGWTDTPPVCWEHGGCVLNVAIKIDGEYPIRIEAGMNQQTDNSKSIRIELGEENATIIELDELSQLRDYDQPTAPAALIKCTLIAMSIVDLNSSRSLGAQLTSAFYAHKCHLWVDGAPPPGQLHLHIRSWVALRGNVAQGTGLGISSILAADLVILLARLFDRVYTSESVVHLVLLIEQMLTTGGGWQDQVGGVYPGFKLCRSARRLPLRLSVTPVPTSPSLVREFESHAIFVHTGLPRLAKNLLRTVLDGWRTRDAEITNLFDQLEASAPKMAAAMQSGEWEQFGSYLNQFWRIKRRLATGTDENAPPAEPTHVTELIRRTESLCYGASLAGAGGGGFLVLFAPPRHHAAIHAIIAAFNRDQRDSPASSADTPHTFVECRTYQATVCAEPDTPYQISVRAPMTP